MNRLTKSRARHRRTPSLEAAGASTRTSPAFLFDLDGTLIDSKLDLALAVNARVKADVVVDVGVQEFTYAPTSETRGRPGP